jgi:outer membrane protein assembly factor BamB
MRVWRQLANRLPALLRGLTPLRAVAVIFALVLLAGCQGGSLHESWPGLLATDGTLYVANLERIQALDAETGSAHWNFPAEDVKGVGPFYAAPVLASEEGDHGVLLVAGFDRAVYALALGATPRERPDELWRFTGAGGQYVATGVVSNGLFIIGNGDGRVYAVRIEDGTSAWEFATRDRVWTAPVVVDGIVYVTSLDHHLYALDIETGELQWQLETRGAVAATPVFADGHLWIGDFASTMYQVDLEAREVVWTFEARNWLWSTPVLNGTVLYFADVGGNVYALDIEDRTMVWNEPVSVDDVVHGQPALSEDGSMLFVAGHEKGLIQAIDTETGNIRQSWGIVPQNPGRLPGDLVTDGVRLYAMPILVPARVQAFSLAAGDLLWTIPEVVEE